MGCFGDMSPREFPLRISLMRISSGQQMPLTAFRGRIWGTALQKNSLKHSLTLFAQPKRLRKPQFWLNLTLQPKLWLRWNQFFYRWVSNLNLQFALHFYQSFTIIIWLSPVYNIGGMNKNEKNFTVTLATRFVSSPFYQHQRLYRQENKSEKGCIRLKCYHKFYCSNCA